MSTYTCTDCGARYDGKDNHEYVCPGSPQEQADEIRYEVETLTDRVRQLELYIFAHMMDHAYDSSSFSNPVSPDIAEKRQLLVDAIRGNKDIALNLTVDDEDNIQGGFGE